MFQVVVHKPGMLIVVVIMTTMMRWVVVCGTDATQFNMINLFLVYVH